MISDMPQVSKRVEVRDTMPEVVSDAKRIPVVLGRASR
jgi:hypothetical protein